jgi:erythromycin esterase-like protein
MEKVADLASKWFQENLRGQNPIRRERLTLTEEVEKRARPLRALEDLQPLIESIQNSKVVMLGEASHGTHEFYHWRKLISQELIQNHGFRFIAVEGDWPPCQQVHQFIQNGEGQNAEQVLQNFRRWPTWMWANREVLDLVQWLRFWNQDKGLGQQVGFHGLDVYSLFESIDEVERLVGKVDPDLVRVLRERYACFEPSMRDEKKYIKSLLNLAEGCEKEVLENLKDLLKLRLRDGQNMREKIFDATQNARIVANAEHYYRSMIYADDESWNIRDRHMMETLDLLLQRYGKGIVWEHNTHIGDYRATDMAAHGHVNIGGLAREEWGRENVSLVGFGTYEGSVIASHAWAGPVEAMRVPPGKPDSIEAHFHSCVSNIGSSKFYLLLDAQARQTALAQTYGHRAIGVVYDPNQERRGNYVPTSLAERYDAFVYFDRTRPLSPLQTFVDREEVPETFPSGI